MKRRAASSLGQPRSASASRQICSGWPVILKPHRPCVPHRYRGVAVLAGSVAPLTGLQMCFNGLFEGLLTGGSRAATSPEAICSALANPNP